jgi:iron complex transport system ATP-binding protein
MSRLIKADSGSISIEGKNIENIDSSDLAKKMSILKQSNQLNIRLSVRELVNFGRFPYSKGRLTKSDEQAVDQALSYMKLESIQDKYLDELSGGQCQRAFIAMVIAQDTEYIFLDEPLNNLDMIVIHDINFASVYSDYIVALKNGEVIREGPTETIIQTSVLKDIYDMDIPIETVGGQRICVYFS